MAIGGFNREMKEVDTSLATDDASRERRQRSANQIIYGMTPDQLAEYDKQWPELKRAALLAGWHIDQVWRELPGRLVDRILRTMTENGKHPFVELADLANLLQQDNEGQPTS